MQKVLVMGLPGSGKTTLAKALAKLLKAEAFNADEVRKQADDWDFSEEGRLRQSRRMRDLAEAAKGKYVVCDFVCPLPAMRDIFSADWVVWMDTEEKSVYEDTNKAFVPPTRFDFHIPTKDDVWAPSIASFILENRRNPIFNSKKPTVQLLGRYQPWHKGHTALFERALAKTGQVSVMVRDSQSEGDKSNPFTSEQVERMIRRELDPTFQGMYSIEHVPNIVNITYGRDVGYTIEQEVFGEEVTGISATKIRAGLLGG